MKEVRLINNIENNICTAIEILVDKAVEKAQYDKTIRATVTGCVDQTIGKYLVKYQDSTFYAYANNTDVTYTTGSDVYILVPNNDMEADKTILGTTKKLGINYVATTEEDEEYQIIGDNCILETSQSFNLQSYRKDKQVKVLYNKKYSDTANLIKLNITSVNEYIKNQKNIICGCIVRTELPREQQFRGNYGIIFSLNFKDNSNGTVVTRNYTLDVDKMRGNPYKILYNTRQYSIFEIDGENFVDVDSISIFCYDFPNSKPNDQCIDDIFIREIELYGAERLSNDDINNYSLTFHTPRGIYFDNNSLPTDSKIIEAQVRVKGKVVDPQSQNLPFYWFKEDVSITQQSLYYNKYGGQGWKCLNQYNIIKKTEENDTDVVEWVPASFRYQVTKNDAVAKENKYKCIVVYENVTIGREIIIKNLSSPYDLSITSSQGTKFYFDIGNPTLKCLVAGKENNSFTYSWAVINNDGTFSSIPETIDTYNKYMAAMNSYTTLLKEIESGSKLYEANKTTLQNYKNEYEKYDKMMKVKGNSIYSLDISSITNFGIYKCTVHNGSVNLGTASIVLTNSLESEGTYSLIINDGSFVYKYDENGVSPTSEAYENPIKIKSLTFSLFDNLGNKIDDEIVRHSKIEWLVPIDNTMIRIPNSYTDYETDIENGVKIYKNYMSFSYEIESRYDITKTNNNIQLKVYYKDMVLSSKTDLVFVKEGEEGTNGTEFFCRIVPNIQPGQIAPAYPMITELAGGGKSWNFQLKQANIPFKVQLWHNGDKILDSNVTANTTEGRRAVISWSMMANKYTSTVSDTNPWSTSSSNGYLTLNGYTSDHPSNIVQVKVTYNGVDYYASQSIITVKIRNDNYRAVLKDNTGFLEVQYNSDGKSPRYNNVNPFEIKVTQKVNNLWEDISVNNNSNYSLTYEWAYLGRIFEKSWISSSCLIDKPASNLKKNQKSSKPIDTYDGQCVTTALKSVVKRNGTIVAELVIPINMYLNRYGNSNINGWDGNSINIDKNGGFILAPQVGAGVKETDNSFTGVVIGKVKETNQSGYDIGLIGYSKGVRSIFLDSKTGKAVFGATGKGQITIDPSSNRAQIYSGNYNTTNKTGMMIDLTTPEIKYGSGNFSVNSQGHLTAKGGGSIAGWNIANNGLWTGKTSATDNTHTGAWLGSNGSINIGSSGKYFRFRNGVLEIKGTLRADEGNIGNWAISNGKLVGNANSYIEAGHIKGSTIEGVTVKASEIRGSEIYGTEIYGGDDIPFIADRDEIRLGDFVVTESSRHIFESEDECTGMSTGQLGHGDWYMWAGYGHGNGTANTIFLVNTGQVRVEGELIVNDESLEQIITRIHNQLGGGSSGCPSQGGGGCGNECSDCETEGPPCDECGSGDDWSCDHGSTPCGGECGSQSCGPGD